jgi:hypothetical protein
MNKYNKLPYTFTACSTSITLWYQQKRRNAAGDALIKLRKDGRSESWDMTTRRISAASSSIPLCLPIATEFSFNMAIVRRKWWWLHVLAEADGIAISWSDAVSRGARSDWEPNNHWVDNKMHCRLRRTRSKVPELRGHCARRRYKCTTRAWDKVSSSDWALNLRCWPNIEKPVSQSECSYNPGTLTWSSVLSCQKQNELKNEIHYWSTKANTNANNG